MRGAAERRRQPAKREHDDQEDHERAVAEQLVQSQTERIGITQDRTKPDAPKQNGANSSIGAVFSSAAGLDLHIHHVVIGRDQLVTHLNHLLER